MAAECGYVSLGISWVLLFMGCHALANDGGMVCTYNSAWGVWIVVLDLRFLAILYAR